MYLGCDDNFRTKRFDCCSFSQLFFYFFFPHTFYGIFCLSFDSNFSISNFLFFRSFWKPCDLWCLCLSNEFSQYMQFFKPRKLFKWVYFRLQSIWLAHSKCRALEIDDPFSEFIALIHISYAFCSKSYFLSFSISLFILPRSQYVYVYRSFRSGETVWKASSDCIISMIFDRTE